MKQSNSKCPLLTSNSIYPAINTLIFFAEIINFESKDDYVSKQVKGHCKAEIPDFTDFTVAARFLASATAYLHHYLKLSLG